jgi:hypothetical protein
MTTDQQVSANRANALRSTGPRSKVGKAASRINARRHGLAALLQMGTSSGNEEVERLARAIAGQEPAPQILALARRIAEAEMTVRRISRARIKGETAPQDSTLESMLTSDLALLASAHKLIAPSPKRDEPKALERYERRAYSRRKTAIRDFDLLNRIGLSED